MGEGKLVRRWKLATALTLGAVIGVMLVAQPAGAHFLPDINHIWAHIKPKADNRYAKKPTASRAAESTTILDSTVEDSLSFATDIEIAEVTIKVGGTKKQLVNLQAAVEVDVGSGTPPFFTNLYLAEGDQSIVANRSQVFSERHADANSLLTTALSWLRTASPGTHTYKLMGWSSSGTTPVSSINNVSLIATTHPLTGLGPAPTRQIVSPRANDRS